MIKGIDINQRIEFVSKNDASEPKTIFVLKPLTSFEMMEFAEMNQSDPTKALMIYLEKSIVEIKNFNCSNVKDSIGMLPTSIIGELVVEMNSLNNLNKEESKN